jgi:hypothetical protein
VASLHNLVPHQILFAGVINLRNSASSTWRNAAYRWMLDHKLRKQNRRRKAMNKWSRSSAFMPTPRRITRTIHCFPLPKNKEWNDPLTSKALHLLESTILMGKPSRKSICRSYTVGMCVSHISLPFAAHIERLVSRKPFDFLTVDPKR